MSQFGSGTAYCLALFVSHEAQAHHMKAEIGSLDVGWPGLWFNASSDHLYDLQVPRRASPELGKALRAFQKRCLTFGHGFSDEKKEATEADVWGSLDTARLLLRRIDSELLGVEVEQGAHE